MPLPSVDGVRPKTAEPRPDPAPQRPDHAINPRQLSHDPIVAALKIHNAILAAVYGPRGELRHG